MHIFPYPHYHTTYINIIAGAVLSPTIIICLTTLIETHRFRSTIVVELVPVIIDENHYTPACCIHSKTIEYTPPAVKSTGALF